MIHLYCGMLGAATFALWSVTYLPRTNDGQKATVALRQDYPLPHHSTRHADAEISTWVHNDHLPARPDASQETPERSSLARIILDSHRLVPPTADEEQRDLPRAVDSPVTDSKGNLEAPAPMTSDLNPSYFDPNLRPARFQDSHDSHDIEMPKIFYGPPPPVTVDPAFNSPDGESREVSRATPARRYRQVPVKVPSYFEPDAATAREEMGLTTPNLVANEISPQDSFAEELNLSRVPSSARVHLKLFDESSSPTPMESFELIHPQLASPGSREETYFDRGTTNGNIDHRQSVPCDIDCSVPCPPLFYTYAWGGLQTLRRLPTSPVQPLEPSGLFEFDQGVAAGVGFGIYHGRNWRADIELAFRSNPLESFAIWRPVGSPAHESFLLDGHLKSYAGMSNFYWDFAKFPAKRVKPYVGVGVGFVFFDPDIHSVGRRILDPRADRDSSFAYQWIAGLNAQLSEQFDIFCEYRFFAAESFRLHTDVQSISGRSGDPTSLWGDFDYRSQNVLMGLRFKF